MGDAVTDLIWPLSDLESKTTPTSGLTHSFNRRVEYSDFLSDV